MKSHPKTKRRKQIWKIYAKQTGWRGNESEGQAVGTARNMAFVDFYSNLKIDCNISPGTAVYMAETFKKEK